VGLSHAEVEKRSVVSEVGRRDHTIASYSCQLPKYQDNEDEHSRPAEVPGGLRDRRWLLRGKEKCIEVFILLNGIAAIIIIGLIFVFIGRESLPVLFDAVTRQEANLRFFFLAKYPTVDGKGFVWQPVSEVPKYSFIPLLCGTLKATGVALLVALPLALSAALYTAEFAHRKLREVVKPTIELLAGIPSVVLGFFALMVMATWIQRLIHPHSRLNALVAGVALGLCVIPIIFTVIEDAMTAVPATFRHAALALGATRWKVATKVVLPAALPGVYAAVALGFGRAVGETMIVLMSSGNAAISSWRFTDSVRTMSATIAAELGEVEWGSPHWSTLFFLGVLLFSITFLANLLGDLAIHRLKKKLSGG